MSEPFKPKAFISYSRTTPEHIEAVVALAEKLLASGVLVTLDEYDLAFGQDLYDFMEMAVKDPTVTHVLMICDRLYAEKADGREGGVGAETQIITPKLYGQATQTTFIPVVFETDENGKAYRPTFLESRYYADFSTAERMANNWDELLKHLFVKPRRVRPALGTPPSHILDSSIPASPATSKLAFYESAALAGRPHVNKLREDFFDACFKSIDEQRPRKKPEVLDRAWVADRYKSLVPLRNCFVSWLEFDLGVMNQEELHEQLHSLMERLIEMGCVPSDFERPFAEGLSHPFDALLYEIFLYWIAVLLKKNRGETARYLFTTTFVAPQDRRGELYPYRFQDFNGEYHDLVRTHASGTNVTLAELVQADYVSFVISLLEGNVRWNRHLSGLHNQQAAFPIFQKAVYKRNFAKLAPVFGVETGDQFRSRIDEIITAQGQGIMFGPLRFLPDYISLKSLDRLD